MIVIQVTYLWNVQCVSTSRKPTLSLHSHTRQLAYSNTYNVQTLVAMNIQTLIIFFLLDLSAFSRATCRVAESDYAPRSVVFGIMLPPEVLAYIDHSYNKK